MADSHLKFSDLVRTAEVESIAAETAIAALREAADLIEGQVSGPDADAVIASIATVAAKYQSRKRVLDPMVQALGAMAGNAQDRESALEALRALSAHRRVQPRSETAVDGQGNHGTPTVPDDVAAEGAAS